MRISLRKRAALLSTVLLLGSASAAAQSTRDDPPSAFNIPDDRTSRYREFSPKASPYLSTRCIWVTEKTATEMVEAWSNEVGLTDEQSSEFLEQLRQPDSYVFLVWVTPDKQSVLAPVMRRKAGPKLSVKGKREVFKMPDLKPMPGLWASSRHFLVTFPRADKSGAPVIADPSIPITVEYTVGKWSLVLTFVPAEVQADGDSL